MEFIRWYTGSGKSEDPKDYWMIHYGIFYFDQLDLNEATEDFKNKCDHYSSEEVSRRHYIKCIRIQDENKEEFNKKVINTFKEFINNTHLIIK